MNDAVWGCYIRRMRLNLHWLPVGVACCTLQNWRIRYPSRIRLRKQPIFRSTRFQRLRTRRCRQFWDCTPIYPGTVKTRTRTQEPNPCSVVHIFLFDPSGLHLPLSGFVQRHRRPGVVCSRQGTRSYSNLFINLECKVRYRPLPLTSVINWWLLISPRCNCIHSVRPTGKDEEGWVARRLGRNFRPSYS